MKKRLKWTLLTVGLVVFLVVGVAITSYFRSVDGQKAFLRDMEEGLRERIVNATLSDDEISALSTDELCNYHSGLIKYELDKIEKYEQSSFSDKKFERQKNFQNLLR